MRIELTLDCCDLERTATFWRAALALDVDGEFDGRFIALSGQGVTLTLQRVPEGKTVKNRMHLDLLVDHLLEEVHRLEQLGATRVTPVAREEFGQAWFVLADPDGNEFCVAREPTRT
ncbi:VOC family protein [Terrabacter sp. MAHUQ-38]|uniref:VOC family protein n=1 Tax=unclassified Terrabacter TaxID=2630222 RepID=UPI00165E92F9|nr:VOC family protein [Terrabacter sp. MAHUQ-38]